MTTQEKAAMRKDLEEKLGYSLENVAELLRSLNEEGTEEVLKQENSEAQLKRKITGIIQEIGIPAHIKGYNYIRTAIMMAYENPDAVDAVTKVLYPAVAKTFGTTDSRVERAVRHAIEVAWERGNVETLQKYFSYTVSAAKGKPTNSEFIAMIADRLHVQDDE